MFNVWVLVLWWKYIFCRRDLVLFHRHPSWHNRRIQFPLSWVLKLLHQLKRTLIICFPLKFKRYHTFFDCRRYFFKYISKFFSLHTIQHISTVVAILSYFPFPTVQLPKVLVSILTYSKPVIQVVTIFTYLLYRYRLDNIADFLFELAWSRLILFSISANVYNSVQFCIQISKRVKQPDL